MHIAVCDDNVADRKQTERLMKREADKWIAEGDTFYTDSFGNAQALLGTPMAFDAFMIDICHTEGLTAKDVVDQLRAKGVIAPMILVCSDVNYREQNFEEGTMFLDKPLQPAKIHELMLKVKEYTLDKDPLIELRGEETIYVKDSDILYAEQTGYTSKITLSDGHQFISTTMLGNMFDELREEHHSFVLVSNKVLLNIDYIKDVRFHRASMIDGKKFSVGGDALKYIQYYREKNK